MGAKARLRATGKTREEAFRKLVKAMNSYITHKFNVDDVIESKDGNLFLLEIEGEVL